MRPIYPHIQVIIDIGSSDGNAFSIMGKVTGAMKKNHVPNEQIKQFLTEAKSGDYNNLIATCQKWVTFQRGKLVMIPVEEPDYEPDEEQKALDILIESLPDSIDTPDFKT